jgi:hypothetical protein
MLSLIMTAAPRKDVGESTFTATIPVVAREATGRQEEDMAWIIGIDEAGYGPNLGPFVMTAVGCRLPAEDLPPSGGLDLWARLSAMVRRGSERADGRLLVDDSKVVHSGSRGLLRLEQGVLATLGFDLDSTSTLAHLLGCTCHPNAIDHTDLAGEVWFTGTSPVPGLTTRPDLDALRTSFTRACEPAQLGPWQVHSVIVCPPRFNALTRAAGTKAAVTAYTLTRLLLTAIDATGADDLAFFIDKQGGRNSYAPLLQQGLPRGIVQVVEEGAQRSSYRVAGFGRAVRFTFEPRADSAHFCVALASMTSKYLRERFMSEFNAFWQARVPGLQPTAGYPGDAARFFEQVRPAARQLNLADDALWRER